MEEMELILNKYINIPIVRISVIISKNIEIIPNFIPKLVLFFIKFNIIQLL